MNCRSKSNMKDVHVFVRNSHKHVCPHRLPHPSQRCVGEEATAAAPSPAASTSFHHGAQRAKSLIREWTIIPVYSPMPLLERSPFTKWQNTFLTETNLWRKVTTTASDLFGRRSGGDSFFMFSSPHLRIKSISFGT